MSRDTRPLTDQEIRAAGWNAVAVASVAYQQEVMALTTVIGQARAHGLTVEDLCQASGLDQSFVLRLLEEGSH